MKFSTFFGKYTICTLIFSGLTILVEITCFGILYHIAKKAQEKDDELNPITASDLNLTSDN